MRIYFQIIGTSVDINTSPSLVLVCDDYKVLFNAGEGLVHHCAERGIKLNNIAGLFGCGVDWKSWGGLGDLVYWQTETNNKSLSIFGPKNLIDLTTSFRYSLWSPDFELKISELDNNKIVTLKNGLTVESVLVSSKSNPASVSSPAREIMMNPCFKDNILFAKSEARTEEEKQELDRMLARCERNMIAAQKRLDQNQLPQLQDELGIFINFDRPSMFLKPLPQSNLLSYIVRLPTLPPKVDAAKAKSFGIKGADIGKISRGESVTLADGKTVTPEQCWASAPQPGPCFIVVSCPEKQYVDSLVESESWNPFYEASSQGALAAVVHMTPMHLIKSEKYSSWMKRFPEATQHLILNRDLCSTENTNAKFEAFFSNLKQIDSEVFYVANQEDTQFKQHDLPESLASLNGKTAQKPRVLAGNVGMVYNLVPTSNMGVAQDSAASSSAKDRADYTQNDPKLLEIIANYQKDMEIHRRALESSANAYDIHFLGTGAASSSSLRNESGIYVDIHNCGAMIMDCGSHSYTQMARKFGQKTKDMLKRIKFVWISHRHPDHNAGLLQILVERQTAFHDDEEPVSPVVICGPYWVEGKLLEYSAISRHQLLFDFYHNSLFTEPVNPIKSFLEKEMGIKSFITTIVWHCRDAYGCCVELLQGLKFAYSGDCRPSDAFAAIASGCDVIIHEATMCDQDQELAVQKNHSCTCEVMSIARKAKANRVVLTHFSKRQDSVPVHDFVEYCHALENGDSCPIEQADIEKAIIAFDMMTVKQTELAVLPKMLPCLNRLHVVLGK